MGAALTLSTGRPNALAEVQEGVEAKAQKMEEALGLTIEPAAAGMKVFFGFASPPTSYGGYGGNASEDPKYYFSYPENWKIETPNKVKKGMQGIDAIVYEKKGKGYPNVFVVTFSRAGEDNKSFKLNNDVESTFQGFAGADYDLQDALTDATDTSKATRELDGETYYDYTIETPALKYLATVTVQTGKVFALFVKAPNKVWAEQGDTLNLIQQSFRTIPFSYKRSGPE